MVAVAGLRGVLDNTGNPYPAVRLGTTQMLTTATGAPVAAAAFQPTTKVVRICASTDTLIMFTGVNTTAFVVAAAHYQDFIVGPGDAVTAQALSAAGSCSIAELV